jgi:hypothetical protein
MSAPNPVKRSCVARLVPRLLAVPMVAGAAAQAGFTLGAAPGLPGAPPPPVMPLARFAPWRPGDQGTAGWSPPTVLASDSAFVPVRMYVAPTHAGGYAVWMSVPRRRRPPLHSMRPQPGHAGGGRTLGGADVGVPPGARFFLVPRAAVDGAGRLHVFWGEPVDTIARRHPERPLLWSVGSIWHASYASASGWSPAREVVATPMTSGWQELDAGTVAVDGRGRVHAFVALYGTHRPWYIADVEVVDAAVHVDSVATPLLRSVALQYLGTGPSNGVLAVAGLDSAATHEHPDAVYVLRRTPAGWGAALRVARGVGNINHLALVRARGDTLHLFWGSAERGGAWPDQLDHAWSADEGTTWRATSSFGLPRNHGVMAYFRAATDGCGVVHVIVFYSLADPNLGVSLEWAGGWRPGAPLPGTGSFLPGDLESAPDGTIDLIWRQSAGSPSPHGLMFSRYQCSARAGG